MTADAPAAAPPSSPPTSPPAKRFKPADTTTTTTTPVDASIDTTMTQDEQPKAAADAAATPAPPAKSAESTAAPALAIQKLSADARLPTRGSAFAAGYDLYAARAATVPARGKVLVDTDLAMAVPAGTYGRVAPRSGLAAKHSIDTGAGVIDADYRGHVRVLLFNHADTDFAIAAGDRIAQLVLERIVTPDVVEVAQLDASVRGAGGFGSTGGFGSAASGPAA